MSAFRLPRRRARRWALLALVPTYVGAGVLHFVSPEVFLRIVPPALPWPGALVALSGAAEIAGGLGVLPRRTRRAAGWGLVALLAAVFPANLHMARHADLFPSVPEAALWARLPLQGALMAWAWWATREA